MPDNENRPSVSSPVREGGYAFYGVVLLALGAVSYSHLKKAESLSYNSIGRFYFLQRDFAVGISQLQCAIAEG